MDFTETEQTQKRDSGGYRFKFSIIMSVYKVEEFIDEAVESLLIQTIGFRENVQIVMVDDGSPDGSGAICDRYGEQYPDNIIVVHKENGGLSSARNEGLRHVEGQYVNFFDPDDILTPDTLENVADFFDEHDDVEIAAIPMYLFGDKTGPHHLNDKFSKGTRVINLKKEWQPVQLSAASSFIKHDVAVKMVFDTRLVVAEDAEQILRIFMENPFLGVVSKCRYMYRRRGNSQVTAGSNKPGWYVDYMKYYPIRILDAAEEKFGYVPRYIQNSVMCDLRWRFSEEKAPEVLSSETYAEYVDLMKSCVRRMDDEVILAQKHFMIDYKVLALSWKFPREEYISKIKDNIYYGFDSSIVFRFSSNSTQISFIEKADTGYKVTVRQVILALHDHVDKMYFLVNGQKIVADRLIHVPHSYAFGELLSEFYIAEFLIPFDCLTERKNRLQLYTSVDGADIRNNALQCGYLCPISSKYQYAFAAFDNHFFQCNKHFLTVSIAKKATQRKQKHLYYKELWKSNKKGERKAVIARKLASLYKFFHRKPIWIISDRLNKGGDNGEALFRYLCESKFKKADYRFAITKGPEFDRMAKIGPIVDRNSMKYKILHLASDCIISSHGDDFVINPFTGYSEPYKDILTQKKYIFLQHGVTKDDISGWLNKFSKNIKGFICAAKPEWDSIVNTQSYFYTEKETWLTGFARFDRLYHDEKNYITIMPTWRRYLMLDVDKETGVWKETDTFASSEYFRFYNSLINNPRLLAAAKQYGYQICFMPHPNVITKENLFDQSEGVHFFTINDEYRDVYAHSNLVLTDYSSAVFDFAYLRKPVVYAQFDKEEFFKGEHVYTKGYFDYERDGFGEVTYDLDSTVDLLIDYMKNDCKLKDKYRERIDNFFAFNDQNNCKRILDKILELEQQ